MNTGASPIKEYLCPIHLQQLEASKVSGSGETPGNHLDGPGPVSAPAWSFELPIRLAQQTAEAKDTAL